MDNELQHIKFRGGKVSLAILSISFIAVFVTKFLPGFVPDYSMVGRPSKDVTINLGCMDHELNLIKLGLRNEIFRKEEIDPNPVIQFAYTHNHALELAGNMQQLFNCADELKMASGHLYEAGKIDAHLDAIEIGFMKIFEARAQSVAMKVKLEKCPAGNIADECDPAYVDQEVAVMTDLMTGAWEDVETSINSLSLWIADTVLPTRS